MPESPLRTVLVCINDRGTYGPPSCAERGSLKLANSLEAWLSEAAPDVTLERVVCLAHCQHGPTVRLVPGDFVTRASFEETKSVVGQRIIASSN